MKKIFLMTGMAACLFACNNETQDSITTVKTDSATNTGKTTTVVYTPTEGDVTYKNGTLMVWRSNSWVEADADVTLDNGIVVRRDGKIVRDEEEVEFEDGIVVDKSGRFFDKAGNIIEDGWEGVKKGAKEAKEGAEKGFNEAKEEVKDVFDDDDKKKQQ